MNYVNKLTDASEEELQRHIDRWKSASLGRRILMSFNPFIGYEGRAIASSKILIKRDLEDIRSTLAKVAEAMGVADNPEFVRRLDYSNER